MLNEDLQSAFLAVGVLAGIGMALALLLLARPRKAPQERLEAVPVPIQNDEGADSAMSHGAFKFRADQATSDEQVGRCVVFHRPG